MTIKCVRVHKNIYKIEEMDYLEHCNCYLIIGKKKCMLIDLGIGLINFSKELNHLIKAKKIFPVITHFHFDHFGGSWQFDKIFCNKQTIKNKDIGLKYFKKEDFINDSLEKVDKSFFSIKPEKYIHLPQYRELVVGDYSFKVLFTKGHDSSSISLYEEKNKILICGDLIYDGELLFNFPDSDIDEYIKSLTKIKALNIKKLLPGHNEIISEHITQFITGKLELLNFVKNTC